MMFHETQAVLDRSPPSTKKIDTTAPKRPLPPTENGADYSCCGCGFVALFVIVILFIYFFVR